jgi:hypothetical protein
MVYWLENEDEDEGVMDRQGLGEDLGERTNLEEVLQCQKECEGGKRQWVVPPQVREERKRQPLIL